MERLIEAVILGVVQGVTEWLPISSTGHLRLVELFLGLRVPILFDVLLHVGTLIVVLWFFRRELGKTLQAVKRLDFKTEHGKIVPLTIVGAIPTVLIGTVYGRLIEDTFQSILPIAIAFILCGLLLYSSRIGKQRTESIEYSTAIIMGIAQGIAIIPGISRSGATIAVALLLGAKREKAFSFSFLLSIPAILGALILTIYTESYVLTAASVRWSEILVGLITAMLVGYFALKILRRTILEGRFHLFALYCWLLAVLTLLSGVF